VASSPGDAGASSVSNADTDAGLDAGSLAGRYAAPRPSIPFKALGSSDGGLASDDLALPPIMSAELDARMRHLVEALAQANPELAFDALFPRDAFIALWDVTDSQKAWEKRLLTPFRRGIERSHATLKGMSKATFVSLELGHTIVHAAPKRREWRQPLWRAKQSRLNFVIEGKPHHIVIPEMTAWRGAWYVTRLR